MTQSKVLLNNVSLVGYLLIPFYLYLSKFGSSGMFPHYSVFDSVHMEKGWIAVPIISLISIHRFDWVFGMTTVYYEIWEILRIMFRGRSQCRSQNKPTLYIY